MSLAAAALLGLVVAQAPPQPVQPEPTPQPSEEEVRAAHQKEFLDRNAAAAKGQNLDDEKRTQCNFFVDNAYFNIGDLAGPFVHNVAINDVSTKVEFRFCIPVHQTADAASKSSLAFIINGAGERATRLTSGDLFFATQDTLRSAEEDGSETIGLKYTAKSQNDDYCVAPDAANNIQAIPYTVDFEVRCNADVSDLKYDLITFAQDKADKCLFHAKAEHKSGCPTFEISGFVQYITSHPWMMAGALIAFGITACFFGGLLFDWVVAVLAGIVGFFITAMIMDTFDGFDVLKVKAVPTAGAVILCLFSFLLSVAVGLASGWFVKKTARIAKTVLGVSGGFMAAVLLYGLLFAQFLQSSIFVFLFLLSGAVAGGYLVYKFEKNILIQLTAFVGAYSIIRGLGLILGGYISEFSILGDLKSGNFNLPATFYAYLAGFVVLSVGGTMFQYKKGYNKHVNQEGSVDESEGYKAV